MPRKPIDYSQTIIYKLCCNDPTVTDIYVGHTTDFTCRKNTHKRRCINPTDKKHNLNVYKFIRNYGGWDNWSMIQLEEFNCNNSREASVRERYWIDLLKPNLNCISPFTSKEEKILQKKVF